VLVTVDLTGRMRFGPDVEWLDERDPAKVDYRLDFPRAESFHAAVRPYWPGPPDLAVTPDYAGRRPRLSANCEPAADFLVDGPARHFLKASSTCSALIAQV